MHKAAHELRRAIATGKPVLGTMLVDHASAAVVNILADCGYDFVLIDCELGILRQQATALRKEFDSALDSLVKS